MTASSVEPVALFILLVLLLNAAIIDLREHRVPNALVLCILLLGFVFAVFDISGQTTANAFGGMVAGFCLFIPFYMMNGFGAGDVKLVVAAGSFLGPLPILIAGAGSLLAGAVFAVFYLAWLRINQTRTVNAATTTAATNAAPTIDEPAQLTTPEASQTPFAFAPFILLGVAIVTLSGLGV